MPPLQRSLEELANAQARGDVMELSMTGTVIHAIVLDRTKENHTIELWIVSP